jgi:hypothetical protein
MRVARSMKWGAPLITGVTAIASFIIGVSTAWHVGILLFLVSCGALYLFGYSLARCPHCGQVWWAGSFLYAPWQPGSKEYLPQENETESFVCRRCRIDIGSAFRD